MKKNLIAVAVAAALAVPAVAVADEPTLYGRAHLSLDLLDNGDDSGTYLSSNSSRLGVKGSEDLGNGLSVLYQLEGAVAWDGGGNWGSTRDTYVGLAGGFGAFLAGRLPARNQWLYDANLFADQLGDTGNLLGWTPGRASNALHYVSPDLSGFKLALTYVPNEIVGTSNGDIWGVRGSYGNGPLALGLTHFNAKTPGSDPTETALTGSYDFGTFKLVAAYVVNDMGPVDWDDWTIGGSLDAGAGRLKLQYSRSEETNKNADNGVSMWALGYDHPLSKRTTVYAVYAATDNDRNINWSMAGWGHNNGNGTFNVAPGDDPSGFSIGVVHNF